MPDFKNFTFTDLRNNTGKARMAVSRKDHVILDYHGKAYAALISIDEYREKFGDTFTNLSFKESEKND